MNRQRLWIIVSIVVTAAVLLMGWFLLIQPMLSAAREANAERATVASQNQAHEALIVKLKAQYADIDTLRASLADMQSLLPPDAADHDLIAEIDSKAAAGGVTVTSVTVSQPIPFVPRDGLTPKLVDGTNFLSMQVTIGGVRQQRRGNGLHLEPSGRSPALRPRLGDVLGSDCHDGTGDECDLVRTELHSHRRGPPGRFPGTDLR